MENVVDHNSLHRTAKYFMDNGRALSHEDAMALLERFGLTIYVGPQIVGSVNHQNALITLVNVARRTLLGGIEVIGLPDAPSLSILGANQSLKDAVLEAGGRVVITSNTKWPSAIIGEVSAPIGKLPCWRLTWNGWRGGVVPVRDGHHLKEDETMALSPLLAAGCCAAEVFSFHAGDHLMAGRRCSGLSLWNPRVNWMADDPTELALGFLPSQLWMIGLGNLGQAYAWLLAALPYENRKEVQLILNDFDRIAPSNESTSILSGVANIDQRKTRVVGDWLESRGFDPVLEERRFGEWIKRSPDEPGVVLCGVDNALARIALEESGFGLIVDAGLGGGPEAFRSISVHSFPSSRSAAETWSRQVGPDSERIEDKPAYEALRLKGMDSCGLAQLASRTVGVPFVGLIAACLVLSEVLRRLNGGTAFETVAGSAAALEDMEVVAMCAETYAFGHVSAAMG
jgi:hypothetical protein